MICAFGKLARSTLATPIAVLVLLWSSVAIAGKPPHNDPADPKIQGSHAIVVSGDFKGTGKMEISDRKVEIECEVTDAGGKKLELKGENLTFADGRFNGTGTIQGVSFDISGRVDKPQNGKAARVTAMFRTADNRVGKITISPSAIPPKEDDDDNPSTHGKPKEDC